MKKFNICCLSSLMLVSLIGGTSVLCISASNEKVQHNNEQVRQLTNVDFSKYSANLTYELSDDKTYYIVSNKNYGLSDPDLVIPEVYEGLPVKEIASEGFAYRNWIKSVAIPKTIEKIGAGAFNGTGLKEVYYNAVNCEDFKGRNWVFYPDETTQNIALTIGKDVERIPANFFFPLSTAPSIIPIVNSITFEEDSVLKEIGDKAFYQLNKITTIDFPDSLKTIGDYAFYGSGIKDLSLPEGLEEIGDNCFANSVNLETFTFPSTLKEIGVGSFKHCSSLEELELNSAIEISKETFKYCDSLRKVTLNDVISIGESAFENCSKLEELILGDSIISINDSAFKNCNMINEITLPKSLNILGNQAFYGCYNATKLTINSTNLSDLDVGNATFYGLGKNSEGVLVTFGTRVEVIPANLLSSYSLDEYIPNISEIIIYGDSLAKINEWAFGHVKASVTYVGKISEWKSIEILEGNAVLSTVNCVKEVL